MLLVFKLKAFMQSFTERDLGDHFQGLISGRFCERYPGEHLATYCLIGARLVLGRVLIIDDFYR